MVIHPAWLRHDLRSVAGYIACAAILANFMPRERLFYRWPKVLRVYRWLIDMVALVGCNWREDLPSLDEQFMGFRRRLRVIVRRKQPVKDGQK